MKKWIIRIAIAFVVVAVIAVVAVLLTLDTAVKKGVETIGPKMTKVEMRLGSAKISPFGGSCDIKDFFMGNPEGFKTPSAIQVGRVKVAVKLSSVLSDVIQIEEINIQAPEITFEGGLGGNNLSKIMENLNEVTGGNQPAAKPEEPKTEPATPSSEKKFYVKSVVIDGAKVNVSITGMGGSAVPVPLPPIHLQEIGTPDKGVSAGEMAQAILGSITSATVKASSEAVTDIGKGLKDVGSSATEQAGKAVKGIKGLFKK